MSTKSESTARARQRLVRIRDSAAASIDVAAETEDLAATLQEAALAEASLAERRRAKRLSDLAEDAPGRALTAALTDQLFRSRDPERVAERLAHLIRQLGAPASLGTVERALLRAFAAMSHLAPSLAVGAFSRRVHREADPLLLPGEEEALVPALASLAASGALINLNHLGEAVLGEAHATRRVARLATDIERTVLHAVSVKISSITARLDPLDWEGTLTRLTDRVGGLLRRSAAKPGRPMVVLDMEAWSDFHLTLELVRRLLEAPDLRGAPLGVVLQAYLPDSWPALRSLTEQARARAAAGGAPVRVRLVKGANLAMERVEASLHGWTPAPFGSKGETDAQMKRLIAWAVRPENAAVLRVGVGSHNVFDIAYTLVLRALAGTEEQVGIEMLAGMAEPLRRVVSEVAGGVLVYAPAVDASETEAAIAYLIRRLDENTGPDGFLARCAAAPPGGEVWAAERLRFREALASAGSVSAASRRSLDRRQAPLLVPVDAPFRNEPDTDWTAASARDWIAEAVARWRDAPCQELPVVVDGRRALPSKGAGRVRHDPSRPGRAVSRTALAEVADLGRALDVASAAWPDWHRRGLRARHEILARAAQLLRGRRSELCAMMLAEGGKALAEGDREVSEAIDFAEYLPRSLAAFADDPALRLRPRGVVVVAPPWNFPLAIPAGGTMAALAAGNAVVLKPAPEAALLGHALAELLWEAGVPPQVLQLLPCADEPAGTALIRDPRVDAVILTGGTETARRFLDWRPSLQLFAETGGKNAIVVSALADRDLAIAHTLASAFGHAGQKCSAASLLILEAELYDDAGFLERLRDAAASLPVGPAWDPGAVVTPLIAPPDGALLRALTSLEPGERWLLEPRRDPDNPALWSPGVKLGVTAGSFTHQTELFGPVLGVMRAADLDEAMALQNATPYGLTAGLQTLDERERQRWLATVDAGNCYIDRGITGAIVERQPFGGRKASGFGPGMKAGGPNYAVTLCRVSDGPGELRGAPPSPEVEAVLERLEGLLADPEAARRAARSQAFWMETCFERWHDPALLLGQDNWLRYQPLGEVTLRLEGDADPLAASLALLAGTTAGVLFRLSVAPGHGLAAALGPGRAAEESAEDLATRLPAGTERLRVVGAVPDTLWRAAARIGAHLESAPPLAHGRVELLRWMREQAISVDYHRHGNLGARESEARRG
ncbi:MAG: bifunctional proline dehydrogenase/L-glutamate gamma-semialdehyde dehydrogenase [Deltaproteobacteria bacterium]|nr:bifunctional proline dehydrogenase/L-glutamate gamma-semialdehyde dehydrogenase [Deltaproteobacteria bacterium]